ncbi:uncharacterized protein LOC118757339, partial [Rhagoletis pomonella]|uniref:uncharacterized protein LOC118757339 n=1 Tax=Rhagoletis pomonella TaxID=28610 RepID=UPI00177F49E2
MEGKDSGSNPATSKSAGTKITADGIATKATSTASATQSATTAEGAASASKAASTTAGAISRNSPTPAPPTSSARQEVMMQAMQKRITMLENTLKATEAKLRDHESQTEADNAHTAGTSNPQFPTTHCQVAPSTELQLPTVSIGNPLPVTSFADSRQSPLHFVASAPAQNVQYVTSNGMPLPHNIYAYSATPNSDAISANCNASAHANVGPVATQSSYPPRQMQALPDFCGKAEDWPIFYTAFTESTAVYAYSDFENNQRLHRCLKGEARETVKSLLIHPSNVNNVIEQLKFRFGRPEQLIRSQLAQVREIAPISESGMAKLVPFATKVNNMFIFLQSAIGGEQHLGNPTLLDEVVMKLPMSKRVEWATYAASIQPYATIRQFSEWLTKLANVISAVYDVESVRDPRRRVVLHTAEPHRHVRCPICQGPHKPAECRTFIDLTVSNRWTEVKKRRLCFSCLNAGHGTRNCQRQKPCATEGCKRMHHKLLHESGCRVNNVAAQIHHRNMSMPVAERSHTQGSSYLQQPSDADAAVLSCSRGSADSKLLFRILPVVLYNKHKRVETYALMDEGSSITMIDNTLLQELGVHGSEQRLNLQWFGGRAAQEPAVVVDLLVSGAGMQKRYKLRRVYGVSNLQLPSQSLSKAELSCDDTHVSKLPIQTYSQVRPKLLIGLDHCHLGLPSSTLKMNMNGPFAASTELGWVVYGPTTNKQRSLPTCLHVNSQSDQSLHSLMADYFDTESFGIRPSPPIESEADARAKRILEKTSFRVNGRFQTGLLWKHDKVELPDSYPMALRRLRGIEKIMSRDGAFANEYKRIIESYIAKGYA